MMKNFNDRQPARMYAFTGVHGSGKTSKTYEFAGLMKRQHPDKEVGIVAEVARKCPYKNQLVGKGRDKATEDAQMWIFGAQIKAEHDALSEYDIVVCDRTICDCIAYTMISGHDALARGFMSVAAHHVKIYDKIYMLFRDPDWPAADDSFRNTNEEVRAAFQDTLIDIYHRMGVGLVSYQ